MRNSFLVRWAFVGVLLSPIPVLASVDSASSKIPAELLWSPWSISALAIFLLCYSLVPLENVLHLQKSKPVLLAAGFIWVLVAGAYSTLDGFEYGPELVQSAVEHNIVEYAELLLFLLTAMTFINSLEERNVFQALKGYLVSRGFSLRRVFWTTGVLAFFLSPVADNLTTALLMGAVVMAVGGHYDKFVALACTNVVVAANAGGAFSPFGDITTLMVWQSGKVGFFSFFNIFLPSLVSWLVPAVLMSFQIPSGQPEEDDDQYQMKPGACVIMLLFGVSIVIAVLFHNALHLPPALGMMFGLSLLGMYGYRLKLAEGRSGRYDGILGAVDEGPIGHFKEVPNSDEVLQHIVDFGRYPAFAIDREHKITHWNKPLEELTGMSAAQMIGTSKHWEPFYGEERHLLADLIVKGASQAELQEHYQGGARPNSIIAHAYDAVSYFPKIGQGAWLTFTAVPVRDGEGHVVGSVEVIRELKQDEEERSRFDLMRNVSRAEWDTLLFFYGVILSVGGLALFGFLDATSRALYSNLGPTLANSVIGGVSALLDNIPVMFAVLTMDPSMSEGQWLLVTLTAGVGGSLLSVGSAAGVALMGTARGKYTFGSHLKWAPAILLGYVGSILCHLWLNQSLM